MWQDEMQTKGETLGRGLGLVRCTAYREHSTCWRSTEEGGVGVGNMGGGSTAVSVGKSRRGRTSWHRIGQCESFQQALGPRGVPGCLVPTLG